MKYRWLIIDEYGGVTGTNKEQVAMMAAEEELVIDVENGISVESAPSHIGENTTYIPAS